MGKGKGSVETKPSPYETQLAAIATDLYKKTNPLRESLYPQMQNALSGTYDATQSPLYRPQYTLARGPLEDQYNVARENILGSTPRGGGLTKALSGLEESRAQQVGNLPSQIGGGILSDLVNKAYGTAFGTSAQQGLSSVASTFGARQGAQMQAQAQSNAGKAGALGGLGTGIGMIIAAA